MNIDRLPQFARNMALEQYLKDLNGRLQSANELLAVESSGEQLPKIMVVGPPRSGTTLFTQLLAQSGLVAYPTNLLSRFYAAPLIGARVQRLLTDPVFNFRNEILEFNQAIDFQSENGKTKGALAPNEFWYFWRRFLPFEDVDYAPSEALIEHLSATSFQLEVNGLAEAFEKPLLMKAMIVNQNVDALAALFEKVVFVWVQRDVVYNVQSALEARLRQFGTLDRWYSFKVKEYPILKDRSPVESVVGQILATNRSLQETFGRLPEHKRLVVRYEELCERPGTVLDSLGEKLSRWLPREQREFVAPSGRFKSTDMWRLDGFSHADVQAAIDRVAALMDGSTLVDQDVAQCP